jgi:hypothetical protein
MADFIKVAPPNSVVFISDVGGGIAPALTKGPRLWSSPTCIVVGCRAFMDGETEIIIGNQGEINPAGQLAFESSIETPNRTIILSTSERETLLTRSVPNSRTHVRVWVNHSMEPDHIVVGLT